jgi:probable F420-dependent oxidoreductase
VARPLRVGIQLPEVERDVRWPEYTRIALAAEEVGFDSLWIGDHLLYRNDGRPERGPWEAFTLLAALAAITRRVTLGPLVACTAFHAPPMLAKLAANLAEISGGRFVLGLGAGWNDEEFRAFGFPFDHRVGRFEEAFEIIRRLLDGERVTFDGRYHAVDDAVLLPLPAERPRLMLGSNGPRMLRAALPHVDAWNTWYASFGNTPEGFADLNARIGEAAEAAGRDPATLERSACVFVVTDEGTAAERPITASSPPISGDAARIASELRAYADAGADEAVLVVIPMTERSVRELAGVLRELDASA